MTWRQPLTQAGCQPPHSTCHSWFRRHRCTPHGRRRRVGATILSTASPTRAQRRSRVPAPMGQLAESAAWRCDRCAPLSPRSPQSLAPPRHRIPPSSRHRRRGLVHPAATVRTTSTQRRIALAAEVDPHRASAEVRLRQRQAESPARPPPHAPESTRSLPTSRCSFNDSRVRPRGSCRLASSCRQRRCGTSPIEHQSSVSQTTSAAADTPIPRARLVDGPRAWSVRRRASAPRRPAAQNRAVVSSAVLRRQPTHGRDRAQRDSVRDRRRR